MTAAAVTLLVTFATVALVYAGAHTILYLMARRTTVDSTRAGVLFARAVAPAVSAIVVAFALVLPAFLRFEPAHDGERAGISLFLLAALGFALILRIVVRAMRMVRLTRSLTKRWTRTATPLDAARWGLRALATDIGAPVVAVDGLLRPRLFVDRSILDVCAPQELAAIAAHERAHVARYDNLLRLLLGACAGPVSSAAAAWRHAAERAADERAADSPARALDLASALIKIARLAPHRALDATLLSTIHDGGSLAARIEHLLSIERAATPQQKKMPRIWIVASMLTVGAWTSSAALLSSAYQLLELLVRHLP